MGSEMTADQVAAANPAEPQTLGVPAVVALLVDSPALADADLTSLQLIAYGGAPMTEPLLRRAMTALSCAFMAVYGMTETAGTVVAELSRNASGKVLKKVLRAHAEADQGGQR